MATKTKGQRPSERGNHPGTTSSSSRLEKSRKLAQKRRETYKDLMTGIMESLPFSREVLTQLDYNSRLRLGLCFLKMKKLLEEPEGDSPKMIEALPTTTTDSSVSDSRTPVFQPGVLQELMIEAMDGFLIVLLADGNIVYLSESIQRHMGLFQSEHMGTSLYDLILEEDHEGVKMALSSAEVKAHTQIGTRRVSVPCSFFCRMRCSRNKVANTQSISPGFKVVHTSGYFQLHGSEAYLVALVKPVTPPSILEIRMEGNMFVTHYALDMRCTFFDGRLFHLMGYRREDLRDKLAFDFHHHDDTEATLECSRGIQARGEGMSGYYRMLTKHGQFVWLQTRATMMFDSHTGNPSYIVCMNFVINKEKGQQSLEGKKALPAPDAMESKSETFISEEKSKAHDPFPIPREDGKMVNPLMDDPSDGLLPGSSTSSSSVASSGRLEKRTVKEEIVSPPSEATPLLEEEPSSTTSPRPHPLSSEVSSNDVSSCDKVGGRFRGSVGQESSLSGVGSHDELGSECVPDSTSAADSSPEEARERLVDSGFNSRGESISSLQKILSSSNSPSLGSGSNSSPSVIIISEDALSTGLSGREPFPGSHSTVLESSSSIYEDPVIQEIGTSSDQRQPASIVTQQQPQQQLPRETIGNQQEYRSGLQRVLQSSAVGSSVGQTQPLGYNSAQQRQPMYQNGQQTQSLAYRSGQPQEPLAYHSGPQQQPQVHQSGQPLAYHSGPQQQPQVHQSGQPLAYHSGPQQQPQVHQSGQPLAYHSGPQQQPQVHQSGQPLAYHSGPQQQPQVHQSGQPLAYHSGPQQQPQVHQSGHVNEPAMYHSGLQQQPQQPLTYQIGQQHQHQPQPQPLSYQQPLSHTHHMMPGPSVNSAQLQQIPTVKQEAHFPCRYSNPAQPGIGAQWQGNGIKTTQYQYQTPQQPSYQLSHETPPTFMAHSDVGNAQQPLQHFPMQPGHAHHSTTPLNHTHQLTTPPTHTYNSGTQGYIQTQSKSVPTGVNPHNLPLFSSLDQQPNLAHPSQGVAHSVEGGASFVGAPPTQPLANLQSLGVEGVVTAGHMTSHASPGLVNLTGEDLQILDFIDQFDTAGGFVPAHSTSHLQMK